MASMLARLARGGRIERYSPPGGGTAYLSPTAEREPPIAASPPPGVTSERANPLAEDQVLDTPHALPEREPDAPATAGETALEIRGTESIGEPVVLEQGSWGSQVIQFDVETMLLALAANVVAAEGAALWGTAAGSTSR